TGGTADRNRSHWSTSKTPSYTKSVSWQHHRKIFCAAGPNSESFFVCSYFIIAVGMIPDLDNSLRKDFL
ncbi:hypothetical protein, partial [Escherichia coli]|uniref:hypothetical protein n=1 Tax=Escherichia coli TaxID=562 RepID=UPI001CF90F07